jgi:hypothetical protein
MTGAPGNLHPLDEAFFFGSGVMLAPMSRIGAIDGLD